MEVKQGYKQSELGVIPEDWDVVALSEVFDFQNGVNADKSAYGHGVPFINVLEVITHSVIRGEDILGKIHLPAQTISWFAVKNGDILFNRTSETQEELGLAAVFEGTEVVVFGGFVIRAKRRDERLNSLFASSVLRAPSARAQIVTRGQGVVRANIGQRDLSKVKIPLPNKADQEAIAEALSDADALIESLEQLLIKKRQFKQGAMQELLTAKKRLPGFDEAWQLKSLGALADIRSGGTPSTTRPEFWNGDVLWCTPTDITGLNGFKYLNDTNRKITVLGLKFSSAELIPPNSIVMTSRATIGECAINRIAVSTNQGFKNFVPFEHVDVDFLYYLLTMQKQRFVGLCSGSTFLEIGKTQLRVYEVRIPATKEEQTAIASILSDMDAEIAELQTKLTKARQIKQGMMQELLTGRIRLV